MPQRVWGGWVAGVEFAGAAQANGRCVAHLIYFLWGGWVADVGFAGAAHTDVAHLKPEVAAFSKGRTPTVLEFPILGRTAPHLPRFCRVVDTFRCSQ